MNKPSAIFTPVDVIVIGAGHAGCEAALASARMGCRTLLVTLHRKTIGFMSCNPAIGGVGKGQLVREIDALGGEMARAADAGAIQFRTLNASKGPAVWSSRAQVDRKKYAAYMQKVVKVEKNLKLYEAEVKKLVTKGGSVTGVETAGGEIIEAKAVIITAGTFLNGLIHIGMRSFPGGRIEEQNCSRALAQSLRDSGFRTLRFKTGTCARLDGKTIDFSRMRIQEGDTPPRPFSRSTKKIRLKQAPCYITYSDEITHEIIRRNLHLSPLYSGKITGTGVRYCPSFEDKIVKFPHHSRHQIFLEPEGADKREYYPNGLSTSLPEEVQEECIHSVPGLEKAKINRFGYGIEHDVIDATQLYPTLEARVMKNLFLAGQINGTTGYEEAAAQGLLAGINAALRVKGKEPFILDRSTSYTGVLVDDLITKGTPEPYRMFTSRVEYRLLLREDNADLRLAKFGFELGLVSKKDFKKTEQKQQQIQEAIAFLKQQKTGPVLKGELSPSVGKFTLYQLLKRPETKIKDMKIKFPFPVSDEALHTMETDIKYSGFIQRQLKEIRDLRHLEKIKIPPDFDYNTVNGLSREIKEKLNRFKPLTLGQANRISGVTPAAIIILQVYLKKVSAVSRGLTAKTAVRNYYRFSEYLKKRFNCRVYKVSVDAGFSCPNRDGRKSKDGCVYCDNQAFSLNSRVSPRPVEVQIKEGMDSGRKRLKAEKFIVYFQAFTNTYAPVEILKQRYDVVKKFKDIAGISIGTRPDCVNKKTLDLIESYARDYEVWMEYGLQSIHNKTLKHINRGHSYQDFLKAVNLTRERKGIKICAHVILGLPGETRKEMLVTAEELGRLKLDGVKIHPLHIIKGTKLEELFKKGLYTPLQFEEYTGRVTEFLEYLCPDTVIQRLAADCPEELLAAPDWILQKAKVLEEIDRMLIKEGRFQGRLCNSSISR